MDTVIVKVMPEKWNRTNERMAEIKTAHVDCFVGSIKQKKAYAKRPNDSGQNRAVTVTHSTFDRTLVLC